MKFIELSKGLSINIEDIESVSKKDQLNSIVQTHHNVYQVNVPYEVILDLLKGKTKAEQEQLNIMKQMGSFSG